MLSKFVASIPFSASKNVAPMLLVLLHACGGGGGGDSGPSTPALQSGVLVDGLVQGVAYSSSSASGVTDANGTFQFGSGQNVTFCIGSFVSGVCQGLNLGSGGGKFLMQMRDLSSGITRAEQNKLRVLQALDSDNNLNNGINIGSGVRAAAQGVTLNFDQDTTVFGNTFSAVTAGFLAPALGRTPSLPSITQAQDHASRSLACEMTGLYEGTYSGSDTGVFEAIIQPNGLIVIRGQSSRDNTRFNGTGSVPTSGNIGSFLFGTTSTGASFNGGVTATGLSGTWTNTGQSGTFTGTKQVVTLPSGASGDVYRGVFSGDDLGSFVLAINSSNNISGRFYSGSDNTFGLLSGIRSGTASVTGTFPFGNYSGTIRNDGKSVFLDGSWSSFQDGVMYNGYALGCLAGSPSTTPIVPSVVAITPSPSSSSTPNTNNSFINSGTAGVTGGGGGTISRATLDRVTTQLQTSNFCCIPGTF
jgi:hypothetical protein